ncbi:hypothetical protein CHS0354_041030 [Potamilus streckersoni]|uniref:GOLD domain-containing protein n=1 Tax=Potamilus streckersoni TaxID=2493646 RepID=A0AAE0W3R6_9BIVA|nr:hypothetical protein CHS0354_041030 [Potamilus streckersoni]
MFVISVLTIYVILATLHMCCASGSGLTFELPDQQKICFQEHYEGVKRYVMEYRVIRGGNNDVNMYISSPNGKILFNEKKSRKGKFVFESSRGDYTFCFSNEFSTFTHKVVYFDLKPEDKESLAVEAGNKKPFAKTASETSCDAIHESFTTVMEYQRDYRLKEALGRHLADVLLKRITWYSIGQTLVILISGFGQVFILKKFFTERYESNGISSIVT